ncbi:MAG: protein kinase [Acidobacteriota bacterium]
MLKPGTRLGPYEIVDSIGSGGMGEVYRARDTRLDRSVAVKILPTELAQDAPLRLRFEREAKTISQFNHPHICTLYDVGEARLDTGDSGLDAELTGGDPTLRPPASSLSYLVMELCDGQSLADRLMKGPLPIDQALTIAIQIADALDRAHRSGIVHRDLKPGNIMLTRSGAKLLDFGLAKGRAQELSGENELTALLTHEKPLTAEGTIVGTFQYMAPEQLEGVEADARSDIFAFGAVLYEMVTGKRAFDGKTRASVIASILEREPVPISTAQPLAPAALERIVSACLAKSPDERWQSALDLKRELEWLLAPAIEAAPAPHRFALRAPVIAALVILPFLAAAGTFLGMRATASVPRRMVSNLIAPAGTQFVVTGDAAGPVTLSPDGHYAAFVATNGTVPELWLQSLDSGTARKLPGTANAMFPFWSPDSRSIAFFAEARMMAIEVDGATPREISYAADARGAVWTPGGQIIFAPFTQTGLFSVAATGGTPKQITFPKTPYTTHRWPSLLLDGQHMIYLQAMHGSPDDPGTSIVIARLDGTEARTLMPSSTSGVIYRNSILFVRGGRLFAQRLENGALSGPAMALFDRVLTDPGTWRAVFSVSDDGLLSMYPASAGSTALRLVWLDSSGKETGDAGAAAIYRDVALSPDGEKLALSVGDPNAILYIEDLRRGVRSRLVFRNSSALPVWTPDSRFIVFQQLLEDGSYALMIKPADGSAVERTILKERAAMQPTSIDAERGILLFNTRVNGDPDIDAVPLNGGAVRTVVGGPGQQLNGTLSPDGHWLAYIESGPGGRYTYVTTYPEAGPKWQVSEDAAYKLWWTAGGKEIRYLRDDGEMRSVSVTLEGKAPQFGPPRPGSRVNINTNRQAISLSADGSRFVAAVLSRSDPGPAILVTNFDQSLP